MFRQFRSAALAVLAATLGIGIYHFDNWYETLANPWVKSCLDYCEIMVMGPGLGILVWMAAERARHRDDTYRSDLKHAHDERFIMLGRIAASVAHEMRNPLQILRLVAEELRATAHESQGDLYDRLDHSLSRLDETVMLAHELARPIPSPGSGHWVSIDLCKLVKDILAETHKRTGVIPMVIHENPAQLPMVMVREYGVRIAISNLLTNAVEAANGQHVTVSYQQSDKDTLLLIRNPGHLPPELMGENALVSSSKPNGLGIGIAIARHLVRSSGGSLSFSALDTIVEARLTLPKVTPG